MVPSATAIIFPSEGTISNADAVHEEYLKNGTNGNNAPMDDQSKLYSDAYTHG
jgi:hypothetical protein